MVLCVSRGINVSNINVSLFSNTRLRAGAEDFVCVCGRLRQSNIIPEQSFQSGRGSPPPPKRPPRLASTPHLWPQRNSPARALFATRQSFVAARWNGVKHQIVCGARRHLTAVPSRALNQRCSAVCCALYWLRKLQKPLPCFRDKAPSMSPVVCGRGRPKKRRRTADGGVHARRCCVPLSHARDGWN